MIRPQNDTPQHCDNVTLTTAPMMLLVIISTLVLSIHPHSAALNTTIIALAGYLIGASHTASHKEASVVIKTVCAAIALYAGTKLAATVWGVEDMSYLTIGDGPESQYRFYGYVVTDILSAMYLMNAYNVLNDPNGMPASTTSSAYRLYGMYPTTILSAAAMFGFIAATTPYAGVYAALAGLLSLSICTNVLFQFIFVKTLHHSAHLYCFVSISLLTSISAILKLITRAVDHMSWHVTHPVNVLGVADIVGAVDVIESVVLLSISCYMLVTVTLLINSRSEHE